MTRKNDLKALVKMIDEAHDTGVAGVNCTGCEMIRALYAPSYCLQEPPVTPVTLARAASGLLM